MANSVLRPKERASKPQRCFGGDDETVKALVKAVDWANLKAVTRNQPPDMLDRVAQVFGRTRLPSRKDIDLVEEIVPLCAMETHNRAVAAITGYHCCRCCRQLH